MYIVRIPQYSTLSRKILWSPVSNPSSNTTNIPQLKQPYRKICLIINARLIRKNKKITSVSDYIENIRKVIYSNIRKFAKLFSREIRGVLVYNLYPANTYLFKLNNRNTEKRRRICSKLKIKTPKRRHWCCSGVFIVNFEYIL